VSSLARVEVPAAVWRKHRLGELSPEDAAVLVEEFEWDWSGEVEAELVFAVIGVTDEVLELAARSVARHPLRPFDAVELASALSARAADADLMEFACFDEALAGAARAEGFAVVP
jgi:uncharacterized protein